MTSMKKKEKKTKGFNKLPIRIYIATIEIYCIFKTAACLSSYALITRTLLFHFLRVKDTLVDDKKTGFLYKYSTQTSVILMSRIVAFISGYLNALPDST